MYHIKQNGKGGVNQVLTKESLEMIIEGLDALGDAYIEKYEENFDTAEFRIKSAKAFELRDKLTVFVERV